MKLTCFFVCFVTFLCSLLKADCVWYDNCLETETSTLPCAYNGPPQDLEDAEAAEYLRKTCPQLFPPSVRSDKADVLETCCSANQIYELKQQLEVLSGFLARCPICLSNLAHFFCSFICSPNQDAFMTDLVTDFTSEPDIKQYIKHVDTVNISKTTATALWQSCRNVYYTPAGRNTFQVLLDDDQPTLRKFLNFFGSQTNVPFFLNFKMTDDLHHAISFRVWHCNESNFEHEHCAHWDCPETPKIDPIAPACSLDRSNRLVLHPHHHLYFSKLYGSLYRSIHLFVRPRAGHDIQHLDCSNLAPHSFAPTFHVQFLEKLHELVRKIEKIAAKFDNRFITLQDICQQPSYPAIKKCALLHPLQYFQNSLRDVMLSHEEGDCYLTHFRTCFEVPATVADLAFSNLSCLSDFAAPIPPHLVFCAFENDAKIGLENDYTTSRAVIISVPLMKGEKHDDRRASKAWEQEFDRFIAQFTAKHDEVLEIVLSKD